MYILIITRFVFPCLCYFDIFSTNPITGVFSSLKVLGHIVLVLLAPHSQISVGSAL